MLRNLIKSIKIILVATIVLMGCDNFLEYEDIEYSQNKIIENQIDSLISDNDLKIDTMKIFYNGKFIIDKSYNYEKNTKHHVASITKSIVSMIYANHYQKEYKKIIKSDFGNYIGESIYSGLSIERFLNMQSGIVWDEKEYFDTKKMYHADNWFEYIISKNVNKDNTEFNYANCNYYLLLDALKKLDEKMFEKDESNLFKKLEIEYIWTKTPEDIEYGSSGLYLNTDSLMKLGYLILSNGLWDDERMLPKSYIDMLKDGKGPEINSKELYRLGWYFNNKNIYAFGDGGQCIFIDFKKKIIIVTTGREGDGYEIPRRIVPKIIEIIVNKKLVEFKSIKQKENYYIQNIEKYPEGNRKYTIAENELDIKTIEYLIGNEEIIRILTDDNEIIIDLKEKIIRNNGLLYQNFPGYLQRNFDIIIDSVIPNVIIFILQAKDGMFDLKFELYEQEMGITMFYEEPSFGVCERVEGVKANN